MNVVVTIQVNPLVTNTVGIESRICGVRGGMWLDLARGSNHSHVQIKPSTPESPQLHRMPGSGFDYAAGSGTRSGNGSAASPSKLLA
jgi:hypothetical protein